MMREGAMRSAWSSLRTASKTSTRVSSTKKASKRRATMAAPSPRTTNVALSQARWPWKIARKATCRSLSGLFSFLLYPCRLVRTKSDRRAPGRRRARRRGHRNEWVQK